MAFDAETALIVVDVQNDFADPGGSLYVPGGEDSIELINQQIKQAQTAGSIIVYTRDWHPDSTPHFEKDGGIWPVHCVAGTSGADFHPDLDVLSDAILIEKGSGGEDGYSAFGVRDPVSGDRSSTGLADRLREAGISRAVVVGLALDYCVKESALDAVSEGFAVVLPADATRPVNLRPGDGSRAVAELVAAGVEVQ